MNFLVDRAVLYHDSRALRMGPRSSNKAMAGSVIPAMSPMKSGRSVRRVSHMREDAPQRVYSMRSIFNALRYVVRAGCPWRMIPYDLVPWHAVQQQAQRWIKAGCFEAMAHDLREVLRLVAVKDIQPSAVIFDGRTIQSTPESGHRAGYDGYKRRKGSQVHKAVDTS